MTKFITNIKDATKVEYIPSNGPMRFNWKGDSKCVSCGKEMPGCWDTVCFVCGDTSCYNCSRKDELHWFCLKHAPEINVDPATKAA